MVRSLTLGVLTALTGCAPVAPEDGFGHAPAVADVLQGVADGTETAGGPRSVGLQVTPLTPGDDLTFTITGANPYEQVFLTRSTSGLGTGPCLGAASLLCLDTTNPKLHDSAFADGAGVATVTQTLPTSVPIGSDVWFQAVIARGASGAAWVKSPTVATTTLDADRNVSNMAFGDLIVTEVMQNPSAVADADGEWFEVHNTTIDDMNLAGLVFTDFLADSFTVADTVFVPAGGYAVLGRSADTTVNGDLDVDYAYGTAMDLGDDIDEIHVLAGSTFIDTVTWDDGVSFPDPSGASMELQLGHLTADDNDAGANWSVASEAFGMGDLGSPGAPRPFVPPAVNTYGTVGVISGADWLVCRADQDSAWLTAYIGGGEYDAVQACASVGYSRVTEWGGTGGGVCEYEVYDGGGGTGPTYLTMTVHWLCEI